MTQHPGFLRFSWKTVSCIGLLIFGCWTAVVAHQAIAVAMALPPVVQSTGSPAALVAQGKTAFEAGRFSEAADLWQRAARLYQEQKNPQQQATSLGYLSLAYQELGQWQEAKQAIADGLQLLQQRGGQEDGLVLAQVKNSQGKLYMSQGDPQQALETWKIAEQLYRQGRDPVGVVGSQINQAQALQSIGLYRQAQTLLEQAQEQLKGQPPSLLSLTSLRSLGTVWQMTGNLDAAQTVLQQSLGQAEKLEVPGEVSAILLSLGNLARVTGRQEAALLFYKQATEKAVKPLARLEAQANQLSLLLEKASWADAQNLWQQIKPSLMSLAPSRESIYGQVNIITSLAKYQRDWPTANKPSFREMAPYLARAIEQARLLQDARAESFAVGQLAYLYEKNQQWDIAKDLTQKALQLAQQIEASDIAYRWQWQLGRIHQQLSDRPQAIQSYASAVTLLQSLRTDLATMQPDIQFSFQEEVEPVYRELVSLLTDSPEPSQQELQMARQVIESLQLAELENFLRASCLNAQPQSIDSLDREAATFYPVILPDRLSVILALPGQPLKLYQTPITKQAVEATVEKFLGFQNPVASNRKRLQVAQEIYGWLIQPVEPLLQEQKISTLVFVLDGILRNLPIAALSDGKQYLIEKYSLAIAPGLQLLDPKVLTDEQRIKVLIGGLTESRQGFPALPGVALESQQIASSLTAQVVLDQDFTRNSLQSRIQKNAFPLIHLATHGQFSSRLSDTFLLTWDDRITIQDLRQLLVSRSTLGTQPIELLVLSACETAEGDKHSALGLAGLSVRSGARSTLATLWSVNDESTAKLMTEFYQFFTKKRLSKAAALRQAQLAILQQPEYRHPYYWAAFVLVGNWL